VRRRSGTVVSRVCDPFRIDLARWLDHGGNVLIVMALMDLPPPAPGLARRARRYACAMHDRCSPRENSTKSLDIHVYSADLRKSLSRLSGDQHCFTCS
jgi:hypothetical protein